LLFGSEFFSARLSAAIDWGVAQVNAPTLLSDAAHQLVAPIGLALVVVVVLLIHAYWDTRPSRSHLAGIGTVSTVDDPVRLQVVKLQEEIAAERANGAQMAAELARVRSTLNFAPPSPYATNILPALDVGMSASWQPPELEVGHRASWLLDTWKKQGDPRWQVDQALRSEARRQLIDEHNESDPVLTGEFVQEVERLKNNFQQATAERDQARQNLAAHLVIDRLQVQVNKGSRLMKAIIESGDECEAPRREEVRRWEERATKFLRKELPSSLADFGQPDPLPATQTVSWRMSLGEHVHLRIKRLLRYWTEQGKLIQ
jgi:hypothetical protein